MYAFLFLVLCLFLVGARGREAAKTEEGSWNRTRGSIPAAFSCDISRRVFETLAEPSLFLEVAVSQHPSL